MTIPNISTNSLVDQTQLNQIIDSVNNISSKFANTISPIYNTATSQVVNSYMGTFAIATNRVEGSLGKNTTAKSLVSRPTSIAFGKTFLAPPLVFASVTFTSNESPNILAGTNVTSVTNSGCSVTVNFYNNTANAEVPFTVSIMAVGLTQL
jgi:hypothetical protein